MSFCPFLDLTVGEIVTLKFICPLLINLIMLILLREALFLAFVSHLTCSNYLPALCLFIMGANSNILKNLNMYEVFINRKPV